MKICIFDVYCAQYTRNCLVASTSSCVASRRRRRCVHECATSSLRLPTDSAMWTQPSAVTKFTLCSQCYRNGIWRNIWRCMFVNSRISCNIREFFHNFFNNDVIMSSVVSTGNCKLGNDCRRVCSHRRRDSCATQLDSFVASASAVCIGHYRTLHRKKSVYGMLLQQKLTQLYVYRPTRLQPSA